MLIHCPECGFERELNASQIPDSAVMATCPQCRHRFRFRTGRKAGTGLPEVPAAGTAGFEIDPGEPVAARVRQAPNPASADPEADDPLPPGAITPAKPKSSRKIRRPSRNETMLEAEKEDAEEDEAPKPSGGGPAASRRDSGAESRRSLFTGSGASDLAWETVPFAYLPVALYQTILQVLFAAPAFFTRVGASRASLLRPSAFYVLIGTFQSLVQHFWLLARLNELSSVEDPKIQATLDAVTQNLSLPLLLISMPPMLLIMLVFYSGLFNVMIRLVQPDNASFSITLRVVAYSAAPGVLCVVPVVGTYAATIWFAFCCFVGCKYALDLAWKRTAMAILPLYVLSVAFSLHVNKMLLSLAQ